MERMQRETFPSRLSRRKLIVGAGVTMVGAGLFACKNLAFSTPLNYTFPDAVSARRGSLPPTPACTAGQSSTSALAEGPFYTPNTPQRNVLYTSATKGKRLVLTGYVLTTDCTPVAGAVVDFWQADSNGKYDNDGFTLRGHHFTDANGVYHLETIKPALYGGGYFARTPHLHVKVQGRETKLLTTQLFFPDESKANRQDSIYRDDLLVDLKPSQDDALHATFHFVLRPA